MRARLLASGWWNYHPYTLSSIGFDDPEVFVQEIDNLDPEDIYTPDRIIVSPGGVEIVPYEHLSSDQTRLVDVS